MNAQNDTEAILKAAIGSADAGAAIARFKANAEKEGLIEIAYAVTDTPFGPLLLASTDRGLVRTSLPRYSQDETLAELARQISPRIIESPKRLDPIRRELDLYFEGKLRARPSARTRWPH